jgi:hypothetical protein
VSEIEWYLDELSDQLAGTGAAGRRALMEAEYQATRAQALARLSLGFRYTWGGSPDMRVIIPRTCRAVTIGPSPAPRQSP